MPKMIVLNEDQEEALIELLNSFISDFNYYGQQSQDHLVCKFNAKMEKEVEDIICLCDSIYKIGQSSYIEEAQYKSLEAYYAAEDNFLIVSEKGNGYRGGLLSKLDNCHKMIKDHYITCESSFNTVLDAAIQLQQAIDSNSMTPPHVMKAYDNSEKQSHIKDLQNRGIII
ncbi:hypothetical protein L3V86_04140 [Thiotrichales bacterium 19S11-10]|nr:hypothetical protein [Thiotrichales bacterium 19S11-10]